jgi:hypothetical protein
MKRPQMLVTLLLLAITACEPIAMVPGGRLSGEVKPIPANWDFADDVETFQLETNPDDPHSVNIWGIAVGPAFYIAGKADRRWAQNISKDPRVRLRIGDALYELKAVPTADDEDLTTFAAEAKSKYDLEVDPDQRAEAVLFRLEVR